MELRLDQIAYMIITAHLIHSKVTYAQIHTHEHELKADNNDLGTEKKLTALVIGILFVIHNREIFMI